VNLLNHGVSIPVAVETDPTELPRHNARRRDAGELETTADLADGLHRDLLSNANNLLFCASIARHDEQTANQCDRPPIKTAGPLI
jgi:hypothetical protein